MQEDSGGVWQSAAQEEARELLGLGEQFDGTMGEETAQAHHNDIEDAGNRVPRDAETADSPPAAISAEPEHSVSEAETPRSFRGADSGVDHMPEPTHLIPISPITPEVSPVPRSGAALPLATADDADLDKTIADDASLEKPEFKAGSPKHTVPHTGPESLPQNAVTPLPSSSSKIQRLHKLSGELSPGASPQIGTSLLRRESLRRRESPIRRRELRKTKSPKKRDTLSRRDTLQEREILQKVIAETNQDPCSGQIDDRVGDGPMSSSTNTDAEIPATSKPVTDVSQPSGNGLAGAERNSDDPNDANVERDLHRAVEAIEVFQQPVPVEVGGSASDVPTSEIEEIRAIDKTNESIARAEVEEAARTAEAVVGQSESPSRTTRSGTRFSDDTNMLRDFLNRAQASKAAKTPVLLPLDAPNPQTSPRRSPRKALGSHKGIASTKQELGYVANRPGTPPGISKSDGLEPDEAEELTATPTSCRRSTRARVPAPSKASASAPSFIPVRRADGTDPVVLQKSQAQELAMVTRANTRRNKGQSKPPLLALKELPADTTELAEAKQRAENGKAVGWAETLASYQDAKEKAEEAEETRGKVRRMRGLGAANGTPAPKKSAKAVVPMDSTPAPKRRGKAMHGK